MNNDNGKELYLEWCLKYTNKRLRNPIEACAEWLRKHAKFQEEINLDFDSNDLAMAMAYCLDVPDLDSDDVLAAAIGLGYTVEPLDPQYPFGPVMFNMTIKRDPAKKRRSHRARFIPLPVPELTFVTRRPGTKNPCINS